MKIKRINDNYLATSDGDIISERTGKKLKPWLNNSGYQCIRLGRDRKTKLVHRIIAECFFGKSELTVDHLDGNKMNNNINNLEYVTSKENNIRMKDRTSKRVVYGDKIFKSGKELSLYLNLDTSYVYRRIREGKHLKGVIPVLLESQGV